MQIPQTVPWCWQCNPGNPWHQHWHRNYLTRTHAVQIFPLIGKSKVHGELTGCRRERSRSAANTSNTKLLRHVPAQKKKTAQSLYKSMGTNSPRSLSVAQVSVLLASDMIYISVTPKLQESSFASLQPWAECKCAFDTYLNRCHNSFPELLNLSLSPGTSAVFLSKNRAH